MLAMLNWPDVNPSYSRPRVSDADAFVDTLLRTATYRARFPAMQRPQPRHWSRSSWIGTTAHIVIAACITSARVNATSDLTLAPVGAVTLNSERDCVVDDVHRQTQHNEAAVACTKGKRLDTCRRRAAYINRMHASIRAIPDAPFLIHVVNHLAAHCRT